MISKHKMDKHTNVHIQPFSPGTAEFARLSDVHVQRAGHGVAHGSPIVAGFQRRTWPQLIGSKARQSTGGFPSTQGRT